MRSQIKTLAWLRSPNGPTSSVSTYIGSQDVGVRTVSPLLFEDTFIHHVDIGRKRDGEAYSKEARPAYHALVSSIFPIKIIR